MEQGPITELEQAKERIQALELGLGIMEQEMTKIEAERDQLREENEALRYEVDKHKRARLQRR
jgi:uncharacterized protein (DUF3084 family)